MKALLTFDPFRSPEQLAYVLERTAILLQTGSSAWVDIDEAQAERFSGQGILVSMYSAEISEDTDLIRLPAASFDPLAAEPQPPPGLTAQAPAGADTAYYIVQFIGPPQIEWLVALAELETVYIQDCPANAAIFRLTAAQAGTVRSQPMVRWVGLYHPAYAASHRLCGREEPFGAVDLASLAVDPARLAPNTAGALAINPFDDLLTADLRPVLEAAGLTVVGDTGFTLLANLNADPAAASAQFISLLGITGVFSVDPHEERQVANQRAAIISGVNQVRDFGNTNFVVNLDGTGEIAGSIDSGFDAGVGNPFHADLAGRITVNNLFGAATAANTADSLVIGGNPVPHGTHTSGTIIGNGAQNANWAPAPPPPNPTNPRGMAPNAQLFFHAARNPLTGNSFDPSAFLQGMTNAHNAGARVHNNSWGLQGVTFNVYNTADSFTIDRFCFLFPESLVLFATHNNERDTNNNGILDQNSLSPECVAKNIIAVGASENETNTDGFNGDWNTGFPGRFAAVPGAVIPPPIPAGVFPVSNSADDLAMFSNRGRVSQPGVAVARRRVRPDLVAPGTNMISTRPSTFPPPALANPVTAPRNFYYISQGTSMATPVVTGAAVLARQFYRQVFDQRRQPLFMAQVAQLIDHPVTAPHPTGCVMAWVRRDTVALQNRVDAARFDASLTQQGNIVQLQNNVGAHPALQIATLNDKTYLLHRADDKILRLSCYDANLAIVNAFGANGTINLNPLADLSDTRCPALCAAHTSIGDQLAVVWAQDGGNNLLFQRFNPVTGAALGANPLNLGSVTNTSPHAYLVHNGTSYAVVWVQLNGANHEVQMRLVSNAGVVLGAQPTVLFSQAPAMRAAHLVWNAAPLVDMFVIAWVDSRTTPDGEIYTHLAASNAAPLFLPSPMIAVAAGSTLRNPRLSLHPSNGVVLFWEDNTEVSDTGGGAPLAGHFDLYTAFLNDLGFKDARIRNDRLKISDTPFDTAGFSSVNAGSAIIPVWQSNDEINSDRLGVYAANLTSSGAFQAQREPNTPLLDSGHYVNHQLIEHDGTDLDGVALAWAGGEYFHLRAIPRAFGAELQLVHTSADGLPDAAFGANGARSIDINFGFDNIDLHWAAAGVAAVDAVGPNISLFFFDNAGSPVNTFGVNGVININENSEANIFPAISHRGALVNVASPNFRLYLVWGRQAVAPATSPTIRYAVFDRTGTATVAAKTLTTATGTARHGWYHFVETDVPTRSIAAWHRLDAVAGTTAVFINRFDVSGTQINAADMRLTALVGDSQNAVIAPRPHVFNPNFATTPGSLLNSQLRDYAAAWQYRPNAAANWEIRFSQLTRAGLPSGVVNLQVVAKATHHATDPQLVWHSDGYGLAWLEQLPAGGDHALFFMVLDPAGAPLDLRTFGGPAAVPVVPRQVSAAGSDVLNYQLVWNGRTFRVAWVETAGGKLRHMQTNLAIPRQQTQTNTYDHPFNHPSAALVKATLINGATNIRRTQLPNVGNNPNDGYGWGRLNLRQSLAPMPPVTMYARDDAAVAAGQTIHYRFRLPANTRLLKVTLTWTDPPDRNLVNNLDLRLTAPDGRVFVGNNWGAPGTPAAEFSSPQVTPIPAAAFDVTNNVEQIVIQGAPALPAGDYLVDVIGGSFRTNALQQFPGQPFALVFSGSGPEIRWVPAGPGGLAGPLPVF